MSLTIGIMGVNSKLASLVIDTLLSRGHKIIALGRSENPTLAAKGVEVRVVDYTNISSLTTAMKGVHTLLSFIFNFYPDPSLDTANANVLAAAIGAGVKRYAPSEWQGSAEAGKLITAYKPKATFRQNYLEKGDVGIEHTAFRPGTYMNLFATGSPKLNQPGAMEDAFAAIFPFVHCVDIEHATATIPGTGDEPIALTRTQDIAAFVAAAVELKEPWPTDLGFAGDLTTWNKVVDTAEKITGKKFARTYVSLKEIEEKLKKDEFENDMVKMEYEAFLTYARSIQPAPQPLRLNKLVDVKPWSVEQFLTKWWGQDEK